MTQALPLDNERIMDLLALEATEGLSAAQTRELDTYFAANPQYDRFGMLLAAAATDLALLHDDECYEIPAQLREKIVNGAAGGAVQGGSGGSSAVATIPTARNVGPSGPRASETVIQMPQRVDAAATRGIGGMLGWLAAAAAVAFAFWSLNQPGGGVVDEAPLTTSQRLAALEQEATDLVRAAWTPGVDAFDGVSGEVVWSDARQQGFMIFEGLEPNSPTEKQYQLWIVDPERDEKPVDGGVFDVATSERVIVPIDAKLAVDDPTVFALTVEKPGGVVVSAGPLVLVAAVES